MKQPDLPSRDLGGYAKSDKPKQSKDTKPITIVTVYTPHEANTYLLDDYLENPTHAKVIKRLKYQKPPVVRLGEVTDLVATDKDMK